MDLSVYIAATTEPPRTARTVASPSAVQMEVGLFVGSCGEPTIREMVDDTGASLMSCVLYSRFALRFMLRWLVANPQDASVERIREVQEAVRSCRYAPGAQPRYVLVGHDALAVCA